MLSAEQLPHIVSDYLQHEMEEHRIALAPQNRVSQVHISAFGVIPKPNKPGKWRLIVDLSAPEGFSVNDGIQKDLCSLTYTSVEDVVQCIIQLGRGAMLTKIDIKQAYRNIPVHPQDRILLGMKWGDNIYVDKVLPFGLRSAPIIFSAVADALQWIIQSKGVKHLYHYLDDFITLGNPGSQECASNLHRIKQCCQETGVPLQEEKIEGPATSLTFLGIELDTQALEIRLPEDKLRRLQEETLQWKGKRAGKKRSLLSLIGILSHACKAVHQGCSFIRRLITASTSVCHLEGYVCLNAAAQSDIHWWYQFATAWNGKSMLTEVKRNNPDAVITTDASGNWGCGGYCERNWFQVQWPQNTADLHITVKELIPIVLALGLWGSKWVGKTIQLRCDNAAAVAIVNSGDSRDAEAMHLRRCMAFIAAKFDINFFASHIRGADNKLADELSRNKVTDFMSDYPQAHPWPTPIPPELLDLVLVQKPDWKSPDWTRLWSFTFGRD